MGCIDIHCHILPGVDDGSDSRETSMQMLRIAASEGITSMIATPHYQTRRFFTPADMIRAKLAELQREADAEQLGLTLYAGTEIYYREGVESELASGRLLTMNDTDRVLVEFSPMEDFRYIRDAMERLRGEGYVPILAHVERFACMMEDESRAGYLRRIGCEIQTNAGSVAGAFGLRVKGYLKHLLRAEQIDYIGTDAHNTAGRAPMIQKCKKRLERICSADYAEALLHGNAEENLLHMAEDGAMPDGVHGLPEP